VTRSFLLLDIGATSQVGPRRAIDLERLLVIIILSYAIDLEFPEKENVFIILLQNDFEHVLIESLLSLKPPFVVLVVDLVSLYLFDRVQRYC